MQHDLVDEFLLIDDAQERLAAVVERARRLPRFAPDERTPLHQVRGCSSGVWLIAGIRAGRCHFRGDADSPLVRGLVALLAEYFSDTTPAEIAASEADPLEMLGLTRHLSPTRRHGLAAVRTAIRTFAQTHSATPGPPP